MSDSDTIQLSTDQRDRAAKLARQVMEYPADADLYPTNFVDQWDEKPFVSELDVEHVTTEYRDVDPSEIIGVAHQNVDRLVRKRLVKILGYLYQEEWTYKPPKSENPPHLEQINGDLYVSGDGIHRTLAHKILDMDEMWAEVTVYE